MPALSGVHADRVRRVPLLQGHEEVRWPRPDEAVVSAPAVHRGESLALHTSGCIYLHYTTTKDIQCFLKKSFLFSKHAFIHLISHNLTNSIQVQ